MKNIESWENQFNKIVTGRGYFGFNVDIDKKLLKKIANFGELEIIDEYTISIVLPPQMSDDRDKILLLLLTCSSPPSECRYNKKKEQLTVEWHY